MFIFTLLKPLSVSNRNIVVVVLDSVRKDFFDIYAKRIQEESSLSCTQCRAASSWSLPSHASILSGLLPSQHGVHTHSGSFAPLDFEDTFLANLDDYTTICVSANAFASTSYEFDEYFDVFVEASETQRFSEGFDPGTITQQIGNDNPRRYLVGLRQIGTHEHPLKSLANAILGEIDNLARDRPISQPLDDGAVPVLRATKKQVQATDGPFFAFLNIMDPHIPFRPRRCYDDSLYEVPGDWCSDQKGTWDLMKTDADEYWRKREGLYSAAIEYVDRKVVSFIRWLRNQTDRETTVIVTADHGENHGRDEEKALVNHKSSLSEGLLHVPLEIINPPEGGYWGDSYVSHLQLGELVEGIAEGELRDVSEESIAAENIGLSAGTDPDENYEYWDRALRCAYKESEKYVWDSLEGAQKYQVQSSQASYQELESDDLEEVPQWAMRHFDTEIVDYKKRARAAEGERDIDEATQNRLEKLGYM